MSNATRQSLHIVPESGAYGVAVASPAFTKVRHKGTTLALLKGTLTSEQLRGDRQIANVRHGLRNVAGDVETELSYGSHDALFRSALQSADWTGLRASYNAGIVATSGTLHTDANDLPVYPPGTPVDVWGSTVTANNHRWRVVTSTTSDLVLEPLSADVAPFADVEETLNIVDNAQSLRCGTVRTAFQILRVFDDQVEAEVGKPYHLFTGLEVEKASFTFKPDALVSVSYAFLGCDMSASSAAPSGATFAASNANEPINAFSGAVRIGGVKCGIVTEAAFTIENGMAPRHVVGSTLSLSPSVGRTNVSGQLTVYFEDAALLDLFLDETPSSVELRGADPAGNEYRFFISSVKFNGGQPDVKGQGPVMLTMPFQAYTAAADDGNPDNSVFTIERTPLWVD